MGVVSIEDITVLEYTTVQLRFQLDSDVCSADLHHNPRKQVGLHATSTRTSACIASLRLVRTVSVVVRTYLHVYKLNITLSQKQLEIQALRYTTRVRT